MNLSEYLEKQGINQQIYRLAEDIYRKGYTAGLVKANQIFVDGDRTLAGVDLDTLSNGLIGKVLGDD